MAPTVELTVAGIPYSLDDALARFAGYPKRTPAKFDYPPRGEGRTITSEEIKRTRAVSSRISNAQGEYFIAKSKDAPWLPVDADLAEADPDERGGLFDEMSNLYWHFAGETPRGIAFAKVHKVLHLKHPAVYPLLDSRLWRAYRGSANSLKAHYPKLRNSQRRWIAVREELLAARASGAIQALRAAMGQYEDADQRVQQHVRDMTQVTDVRLLDVLVW